MFHGVLQPNGRADQDSVLEALQPSESLPAARQDPPTQKEVPCEEMLTEMSKPVDHAEGAEIEKREPTKADCDCWEPVSARLGPASQCWQRQELQPRASTSKNPWLLCSCFVNDILTPGSAALRFGWHCWNPQQRQRPCRLRRHSKGLALPHSPIFEALKCLLVSCRR